MPQPVLDVGSNLDVNLLRWSKALKGGGDKLAVFKVVYSGKRRRWTASEISERLLGKVSRKRVTEVGKKLVGDSLVNQVEGAFPVVYEKRDQVHHYKAEILAGARNNGTGSSARASSVADRPVARQATSKAAPRLGRRQGKQVVRGPVRDVFLCHASEDKAFVNSLVRAIEAVGISVWYDKNSMSWGDDLRGSIDKGLRNSRYGIVVFSKAFLKKKRWTEHELNGLFAKERGGRKVILPIWHKITQKELEKYSLSFVDRIALRSDEHSFSWMAKELKKLLRK